MNRIKLNYAKLVLALMLCIGLASAAFGQQAQTYTLHLHNNSGYTIREIRMSPSDILNWGRDLLEDDILFSPGSVDVINISRGNQDLLLVDEDGDSCVKTAVYFSGNRTIDITPQWLIGCEFSSLLR